MIRFLFSGAAGHGWARHGEERRGLARRGNARTGFPVFLKLITGLLSLYTLSARAQWTVNFGPNTNYLGQIDTNSFRVTPILQDPKTGAPILANGKFITGGPPTWATPNTNGLSALVLMQGDYQMTNSVLGQGVVFAVPSGTGTMNAGDNPLSGFNVFNYTAIKAGSIVAGSTNISVNFTNPTATIDTPYAATTNYADTAAGRNLATAILNGGESTNQFSYLARSVENRNSQFQESPPMGCEPWFWKGVSMTETDYWTLANIYYTNGLKNQYIDITGGWQGVAGSTNSSGVVLADPAKFPHGLAFTVNVIHTNNQFAMIYEEPTALTAEGLQGLNWQFTLNASNFIAQGIDAVRLDYSQDATGAAGHNARYAYAAQEMSAALESFAGHPVPVGGNGWDTNQLVIGPGSANWFQMRGIGDLTTTDPNVLGGFWQTLYKQWQISMPFVSQGGPGHWFSVDYLPCNLGPGYAVLYAFLATPRFVSYPYAQSDNALGHAVFTNQWLIDVNLDPHVGTIVRSNADGSMIGRKMLKDGKRFMAFFNPSTNANVTLDFQAVDAGFAPGTLMDVFDTWFQTNALAVGSITSTVPFLTNSGFIVSATINNPKIAYAAPSFTQPGWTLVNSAGAGAIRIGESAGNAGYGVISLFNSPTFDYQVSAIYGNSNNTILNVADPTGHIETASGNSLWPFGWTSAGAYGDGTGISNVVAASLISPAIVTNRLYDARANEWDISSGFGRLSYSSFSPTPYFAQDGISCAGNSGQSVLISLPEWVTNVSGYVYMQCTDATNPQAWTNTYDGYWYTFSSNGRLTSSAQIYSGTSPTTVTVATNGLNLVTWTNIALARTNCPKALSITFGASTNATTRYFLGPMRLLFN